MATSGPVDVPLRLNVMRCDAVRDRVTVGVIGGCVSVVDWVPLSAWLLVWLLVTEIDWLTVAD